VSEGFCCIKTIVLGVLLEGTAHGFKVAHQSNSWILLIYRQVCVERDWQGSCVECRKLGTRCMPSSACGDSEPVTTGC
jgi:hypothetical protein